MSTRMVPSLILAVRLPFAVSAFESEDLLSPQEVRLNADNDKITNASIIDVIFFDIISLPEFDNPIIP